MRQLFLDTETTGLKPEEGNRIVELGVVEYINRLPTGREFHTYCNPERDSEEGAFQTHGLASDFLAEYPRFVEIVESLLDFVRDSQVIIHNAPFDVGFLQAEIDRCNQSRADNPLPQFSQLCRIEDSLQLARNKYGGRNDLDTLCDRLKIERAGRHLHGALVDAHLLAKVYIAMTSSQGSFDLALAASEASQVNHLPEDLAFLRVVKASAEELASHNAYMQTLKNT